MFKPTRKTPQQLQAEEEAKYKQAVDVLKKGGGGLSKDFRLYRTTVRQYEQKKRDLAAKEAAAKAAAQLQFEKDNPKLIQPEQPATVGPAQQDQTMRQQMLVNLENRPKKEAVIRSPQEQAENEYLRKFEESMPGVAFNRDKVLAGFRANQNNTEEINRPRMEPQVTREPIIPNPTMIGPKQQFNAMQQQMYQTQPQPAQQQPQPEQPQPTQQQNQLQEQQPNQIEQAAPVKKTFIKRKNTEM